MKKLIIIALTAFLLTGCDVEPLQYRVTLRRSDGSTATYLTASHPQTSHAGLFVYTDDGRTHVLSGDITIERLK